MIAVDEFKGFIAQCGYEPPIHIEPGRFVRFPANGKRGDSAGYAKLFPDLEGGVVGDFRTGHTEVWQAKRERPQTEAERHKRQEQIERAKHEAQTQREQDEKQGAVRATQIWGAAERATEAHPYLSAKGIKAAGFKVYRGPLAINGIKCDGALVVPFRNIAGELRAVEFVGVAGKRFLPGASYKKCYFALDKPGPVVCIAEGAATAASVHEATGLPVRAAGSAGNLLAVAQAMREKLPDARLIICADNDTATTGNPGVAKATEAAQAVGGMLAVCPAIDGQATDFNDLAQAQGAEAVKQAIEGARAVQTIEVSTGRIEQHAGEEWPMPVPFPSSLPPVPAFDYELLPDALRDWIKDTAERLQCPAEFHAVGAIVALGSVIGRKLSVRAAQLDDWTEFPNLWGVIIGAPGVLKSPALNEALRPLRKLEAVAAEEHREGLAEWQAKQEAAKIRQAAARQNALKAAKGGKGFTTDDLMPIDDDAPSARRYIVNDCSHESLAEVLRHNPNGVLAFRDELYGLVKSLDREGMEGARAFYLSAYSAKEPYVVDRIGRGLDLRIEHCCISMLGSIQPAVIGALLRDAVEQGGGDGFLSRFSLLVWPDVQGAWRHVDRLPDSEAYIRARALFERMDALDPASIGAELDEDKAPYLRFDADAAAAFLEWRQGYEDGLRAETEHPALIAHFAKYRKLVPALALIFHVADNAGGRIGLPALLRALAWQEVLDAHARRAYASVQQAKMDTARALLNRVRHGDVPNPFTLRDVYRNGWGGLSNREQAREAAGLLADFDYLRPEQVRDTGGRPKEYYCVNPRALT